MAKFWEIVFLLLTTSCIQAQVEKIDPERPDQSESPDLVKKNIFQAEFGFNKENNSGGSYDLLHPTTLFKYGLKKIELRMEIVSRSSYEDIISNSKWENGFDPVTIGFKMNLFNEKFILPKTSLITSFAIPAFSSKAFHTDHIAPSIKLVMLNTLSDHADLSYNLGAEWDGFSTSPDWLYSISQGFGLSENWNIYIEVFGSIHEKEQPQHNIDAGIGYCLSNDTKIDISGGFGISGAAPKNYFAVGFSFRVDTKHGK